MESVEQDYQLSFSAPTLPIPPKSLTSTPVHGIDKPARGPFTNSSNPFVKRPASPPSGMAVRRMDASLRAVVGDDDVFAPSQHPTRTLRRRSSRLSKWLEELRIQPSTVQQPDIFNSSAGTETVGVGTKCNPYLAYPHLSLAAIRRSMDDASSMHDYVVVNDDDVQEYIPPEESTHVKGSHRPSASADTTSQESTIRLINTPRSLRRFNLSVRSASPSASSTSRSPSRLSMFQRSSHATSNSGASNACHHGRSFSHQTSDPRSEEQCTPGSSSSWRWRPSVLGHFSSLSDGGAHSCTRDSPGSSSRPSMSSTTTHSSYATQSNNIVYEEDRASHLPSMPQKSHFLGSLRSRSQKAVTSSLSLFKSDASSHSSPTLLSLPASEPQLSQPSGFPSPLARKSSTIRLRFSPKSKAPPNNILPYILVEEQDTTRPCVVYTGKSHAPRVSLSSIASQTRSTKKKLVISGIPLNDARRLDALQKWCQSFGEVDQITRMPNGDLQIKFHKAEVADTVCRVRAKVYIAGVGSVYLSWYSGNKRP
ncbi:hypothetical protein K503DRAFT_766535 [Rhizopogon vinicolor AM-OR11-026]|uniref:RRM domain-containing protein n=1 Tax=Rhizopogon vinicolor AM-OR11-026 TaxID=1314800 RepID=A0A1B7ND07_9AGAM|nr:hypothetical protein K503DRAFT_766535 [Rhizopogon vinicolor AM-OR11-026]